MEFEVNRPVNRIPVYNAVNMEDCRRLNIKKEKFPENWLILKLKERIFTRSAKEIFFTFKLKEMHPKIVPNCLN